MGSEPADGHVRVRDEHFNKTARFSRVPLSAKADAGLIADPIGSELLRLGFSFETVGLVVLNSDG